MMEFRQSDSIENLSEAQPANNSPGSHRGGRKRPNKKRRCRSRASVEDDSFHSDGFNAFWQNYQKAFQWANNQEVAYWRSKAVALELENQMLRQHIKRLSINEKVDGSPHFPMPSASLDSNLSRPNETTTHSKRRKKRKLKKQANKSNKHQSEEVPGENINDSQLELEVTEEMKDFLELHMRHKMEQVKKQLEDKKKYEEAATAAGEENAKLISQPMNFGARADELKLLYGDASPMIHGMETAIQLTFRQHCEKTGARLWPNIPLRF